MLYALAALILALFVVSFGQRARRWGDHDRYFGPLTFHRADKHWRPITLMLCSGGDEAYPMLRLSLYWFTIILATPGWLLRPHREWREVPQWATDGTAERLGRTGYWNLTRREYGFTYAEGHLSFHYGKQAMDSSIDQNKGFFLPWKQWRHVRRSFLNLNGSWWANAPQLAKGASIEARRFSWDMERSLEAACERVRFHFLDFDGEAIVATCHIEEREWHRGEGWFRWLGWFQKRIERSLMLDFSSEVGKRKGSWKGGTVGHSITMKPGETPEAAFMRYCDQEGLTFAGVTDNYLLERYGMTEKPDDWNVAVLGHFHGGPEARPASETFSAAFHERAGQPLDPDPDAA